MAETTTRAADGEELEERERGYQEILKGIRLKCDVQIAGELETVVRELLDETLGTMDEGRWQHADRWGRMQVGEDQPGAASPEAGKDSVEVVSQFHFRKHMRHLARCMGREAEIDREGGGLHPDVLRGAMIKVMIRSRRGDCRPMRSTTPGGRCQTAPEGTVETFIREPKVCDKTIAKYIKAELLSTPQFS